MPNRILRDWTDSEKINILSAHAERFFTRLIMVVDDFGCFTANLKMLRSSLFPLLIDQVREADITRWMAECQKAGIVVLYEVDKKGYLQVKDFKQRLRLSKSKYPQPNDGHSSDVGPPETKRSRNEDETEEEGPGGQKNAGFIPPYDFGAGQSEFSPGAEPAGLVPDMLAIFLQQNKGYVPDNGKDFPALGEIVQFIKSQERISVDPATDIKAGAVVKGIWGELSKFIANDNFHRNQALITISKHIQTIVQKFRNGYGNPVKGFNAHEANDLLNSFND